MKKLYDITFAFITRSMGYGIAVVLFSILWSGLITEANLLYISPTLTHFFDFSDDFFLLLKILFVLPFPTAVILYGGLTRIGIPALLPSFRTANRLIVAEGGSISITAGLSKDEYSGLLRAINRIPVIFFTVAVIEVAYIDIVVLAYAFWMNYSAFSVSLNFLVRTERLPSTPASATCWPDGHGQVRRVQDDAALAPGRTTTTGALELQARAIIAPWWAS